MWRYSGCRSNHQFFDVFSVLNDWIELISFALSQVSRDTSLEYPQQGFLRNSKNEFLKDLPIQKCNFYPFGGNRMGFLTIPLHYPYKKATLSTSCDKKIELYDLMTRSTDHHRRGETGNR